jgi:hypothetical protein
LLAQALNIHKTSSGRFNFVENLSWILYGISTTPPHLFAPELGYTFFLINL